MRIAVLLLALVLSACATPAKYQSRADISDALGQNMKGSVNVAPFKAPDNFSSMCRIAGPIYPPDFTLTFEGYIQSALTEELKAAGKLNDKDAKITLTGAVEKLAFSTTANGVTGGTWDIGLRVTSSNGKSTYVSEHYVYETSIMGAVACQQATDAFLPAVQNLISKLARSSEFKSLVTAQATEARAETRIETPRVETRKEPAAKTRKGSAEKSSKSK